MATLEMLIGIPGAGKSYYSSSLRGECEPNGSPVVISSDEIRKEINGTLEKQDNPGYIFGIAKKRILKALYENKYVILDATNIKKKDRKSWIEDIKLYAPNTYIKATVIATPYEECIRQNNKREKDEKVPDYVMERMHRKFKMPDYEEGFNEINLHYNKPEYKNNNEYILSPEEAEIDR